MACTNPLLAYKGNCGKMVFLRKQMALNDRAVYSLPCGQCMNCRLSRSREWAVRCTHESSLHEANSFITLTYDDKNLPLDESLCKEHLQKFMKRLRDRIKPIKIRYFACGEYGGRTQRPHYHICLFGYDFPDKILHSRGANDLFTSELLQKTWEYGFSTVGEVNFDSARYVAGYVHKKITGSNAAEAYTRPVGYSGEMVAVEPEFMLSSRRPGIGYDWYRKYSDTDLWSKNYVTLNGKQYPVPDYYWQLLKKENPTKYETQRELLRQSAEKHTQEISGKRMGEIEHQQRIIQSKTINNRDRI